MAHHGDDWTGSSNLEPETFLRNELKKMQESLDGQFPLGKLNKRDEGALAYAVGTEGWKVCIRFPKPITWIGLSPDDAMDLAQCLIKHARKAGLTKLCTIEL